VVTFSACGPLCSYLNGELYEELYARLYIWCTIRFFPHREPARVHAHLAAEEADLDLG
jgi:hypothetical protein